MATEPAVLDCRGQKCPLPVLKAEKQLASIAAGTEFILLATDPMAKIDIPLHCRQNGHACDLTETDGVMRFRITKSRA